MLTVGTASAVTAYKQLIAAFKSVFSAFTISSLALSRQGYLFNNSFSIFITYNNAAAIAA